MGDSRSSIPACTPRRRVGLVVPLDYVHAFDNHFVLSRLHFDDATCLAPVFARDDDHAVVLSHIDF